MKDNTNMDNIGILDPDGINNNPLTDKPYSDLYKELGKKWSNLPAYKNHKKIIKMIEDNQVLFYSRQLANRGNQPFTSHSSFTLYENARARQDTKILYIHIYSWWLYLRHAIVLEVL
jgi:hypothetical protein